MINKDKNENVSNNMDDYDMNSYLYYIKINKNNKLEGLKEDSESQILMDLVNSISVDKDDNIGKELNKFFIQILPENKDGDVLKVNYALSKRIKDNLNMNKTEMKKLHEEYMTQIMNTKINQSFILTRDVSEKLSLILSTIFKKIKKNNKFNKYEEVLQYISDLSLVSLGVLERYKDKSETSPSAYIYVESPSNIYNDDTENLTGSNNKNLISIPNSRVSHALNYNRNIFSKSVFLDINTNIVYRFRELKLKKPINVPLEVLVLREKFEHIKKLKLILKRNISNNELLLFEQKDIINYIFILFNLKWLFPLLFEIELDLTNESILKDQIILNNDKFQKFMKKTKRNKKATNYQNEFKKRIFDINKKSIFNEQNKNIQNDDAEILSGSFSMLSSVKDYRDEEIKKQEDFLNKYMPSLEMIIIYWYFISKIDTLKTCNFTIPINLEDKILLMLKEQKIFLFDFNLLSNLSSDKIIDVTLDFNSLDNKLFQQVLNFLFKIDKMKTCRLSFFPSEEYFESQFLFNLLLNSDNSKGAHYRNAIRTNEDIDLFILRKLSEYFEININKFFFFFINRPTIKEISLIFDMPNLLYKIDYYELIIIKLIINMFIYIDKSGNNSYFGLDSFTIIADNLFLDNKKHPFLNIFFDNMNIYKKKSLMLQKLTLKLKMAGLTNIYKIIPYHVNYLSLGSFDLESFEYFVEYITSTEFNIHSKMKSLQISLANSIVSMDQCYDLLVKLLVEYPKNMEEISIYTNINTNYLNIKKLLDKTNYNKIEKIFLQFSKNSLKDKDLQLKYGKKLEALKDNRDNNFTELFFINHNEKIKDKILRIMYKIGKKYNKKFMDCNIFSEIEKFISQKDRKQVIIQYK